MSFVDHCTSIDSSRWGVLTAGAGTVVSSDSNIVFTPGGAVGDVAAMYYKTRINKAKSQIWQYAFKTSHVHMGVAMHFVSKATEPVAEDFTTFIGRVLGRQSYGTIVGDNVQLAYWNSAGTQQQWDGSTNAWAAPSVAAMGEVVLDDYHVITLEIDGPGDRFRLTAAAKSNGSAYSADHGLQLWAVTDWIAFSSTRFASSTDLWLVFGWPANDVARSGAMSLEWVRHADGPLQHGFVNQNDTGGGYNIKHGWSYDGKFFAPESRSGVAIAIGTGWESTDVKNPNVVRDHDGTYYMVYQGQGSGYQIGIASSPTALDGSWTKYASNPILTGTGPNTDREWLVHPHLVKDETDPDPNKRWKIFVGGVNVSGTLRYSIHLYTASAPLGTWTYQAEMLGPGAASAFDETGPGGAFVFLNAGVWEMWYSGMPASPVAWKWQVGRATATTANGPFTRDGSGVRIAGQRDEIQDLSANLAGRTLSLTDTTGFAVDQLVIVDQDASATGWNMSRVRKITANTSLELYHALQGFTTASAAQVRGYLAGAVTIHHVERVDGEWRFYCSLFAIMDSHATFRSFTELSALFTSPGLLDAKTIQWLDSPLFMFGQWNNKRSSENPALVRSPIGLEFLPTFGAPPKRRRHQLLNR